MLLLAIPLTIPAFHSTPTVLSVRWIKAPPAPVVLPIPDEPKPQKLPQRNKLPVPAPRPTVAVDSIVSVPVSTSIPDTAESTDGVPSADVPAATLANARLAYESVTEPRYPMDSIRRGEHGTVLLRVLVGRDGFPKQIDIERSSGFPRLDRSARESVLRWRFRPVQINGVSVQASGLVPISFERRRG